MKDTDQERQEERRQDDEIPGLNIALTSLALVLLIVVLGVLMMLMQL